MNYNDPAFIASRLLRQFKSWGDAGEFTMPFTDLPTSVQRYLTSAAALESDELPVLACIFDEYSWTVLTTNRLVWRDSGAVRSLLPEEIEKISIDLKYMLKVGGKKALDRLDIMTNRGKTHRIRLEPGRPFSGFRNALPFLVQRKKTRT